MFGYSLDDERAFHLSVAHGMLLASVFTFIITYFIVDSPFGKHTPTPIESKTTKWWLGPMLPTRASWFVFEIQNVVWSAILYSKRNTAIFQTPNAILLSLFVVHYINRAIFYPLRMKKSKPMPFLVAFFAFVFCTVNGYLQAQGLCQFLEFPPDHIYSLPFLVGIAAFIVGLTINQQSDSILRNLRRVPGEYKIPYGGMFEYVSGAHHFGEMVEWLGFAIASMVGNDADGSRKNHIQGMVFFIYTASNLIPRAVSHHEWYRQTFKGSYPEDRKAVIPFVW